MVNEAINPIPHELPVAAEAAVEPATKVGTRIVTISGRQLPRIAGPPSRLLGARAAAAAAAAAAAVVVVVVIVAAAIVVVVGADQEAG